ncbi:MAG: T9SS type A sorting domain-containing protein [Flavobacteriales bacterium]|nr:T9SS type A sorting domain-containing protein [Flavobacteriales bacterium]MCB9168041.1 T9SS type A sorting domain-containing protein [Flavobacteriales bacterium]
MRSFPLLIASVAPLFCAAQFGLYSPLDHAELKEVKAIDLDQDGLQDVLGSRNDTLVWYRNMGLGTFSAAIMVHPGQGPMAMDAADLDGDLDIDIAFAQDGDTTVYWIENTDGTGTFGMPLPIDTLPAVQDPPAFIDLRCADITGDGTADILLIHPAFPSFIWYASDNGAFGPRQVAPGIQGGPVSRSLAIGDIDGNGSNDVLLNNVNDLVVAGLNFAGNATTWIPDTLFSGPITPEFAPDLMDIDGDSDTDIGLCGFAEVAWAPNSSNGVDPFPEFDRTVIAEIPRAGAGRFGHLGCGPTAFAVFFPTQDTLPTLWSRYDTAFGGMTPPLPLEGVVKGVGLVIADLDGDGREDLLVAYTDSIGWYAGGSSNVVPSTVIGFAPFDTLCQFGGSYPLVGATPAGGHWSGTAVENDHFVASGQFEGTYHPAYAVQDTSGCPIAGSQPLELIDHPEVSGPSGYSLTCPDGPLPFTAQPVGGIWDGVANASGVVDADAQPRPWGGPLVYLFTDVTGATCVSFGPFFSFLPKASVGLTSDSTYCSNLGVQEIHAMGPSNGSVTLTGPLDSLAYPLPSQVVGYFNTALPPGLYTFGAFATGPGRCPDSLFTTVEVLQAPTVVGMSFDTLCAASGPYPLSGLVMPAGGIWTGSGIVNDQFDVDSTEAGAYPLSYLFVAPNGCRDSLVQIMVAIDGPGIEGPADSSWFCSAEGPITWSSSPSGCGWSSPLDTLQGTLDPGMLGTLPFDGQVTATYIDATGGSCATVGPTFHVRASTPVNIFSPAPFCVTDTIGDISGTGGTWGGAASGDGTTATVYPEQLGIGSFWTTLTDSLPGYCRGTDSVLVAVFGPPATTLDLGTDTLFTTSPPLNLSGGSPGGGQYLFNDTLLAVFDPAFWGVGTYPITYLVDGTPCDGSSTDTLVVLLPTAMQAPSLQPLQVRPNPASDALWVVGPQGTGWAIELVDALGRVLLSQEGGNLPTRIALDGVANGGYVLRARRGDVVLSARLVVAR